MQERAVYGHAPRGHNSDDDTERHRRCRRDRDTDTHAKHDRNADLGAAGYGDQHGNANAVGDPHAAALCNPDIPTNRLFNRCTACDLHKHVNAPRDEHAHVDGNGHSNSNAHINFDADADPDEDPHGYTHTHPNADTDSHRNGDTDGHAASVNCHGNAYAKSDPNGDRTACERNHYRNRNSHGEPAPERVKDRGSDTNSHPRLCCSRR